MGKPLVLKVLAYQDRLDRLTCIVAMQVPGARLLEAGPQYDKYAVPERQAQRFNNVVAQVGGRVLV